MDRFKMETELARVTTLALTKCLGIVEGEKVLVVNDGNEEEVAQAFYVSAKKLTKEATLLKFPPCTEHGQEPPQLVAEQMLLAHVALLVTSKSLSHTRARKNATDRGVRIASMPMITKEMVLRALDVDYEILARETGIIAQMLTAGRHVEINTPAGTNLKLDLTGRTGQVDTGNIQSHGSSSNLPGGEAYIAPVETATNGRIVFNGSIAGWGKLENPITVVIQNGRAVEVLGGAEAEWLTGKLKENGTGSNVIAELGIGTNPKAVFTGNILEDEKSKGTIHLALGSNINFGGENEAPIHLDGVLFNPTVQVDGQTIIADGIWKF